MTVPQSGPQGADGESACGRAPLVEAITAFLTHERGPAPRGAP